MIGVKYAQKNIISRGHICTKGQQIKKIYNDRITDQGF